MNFTPYETRQINEGTQKRYRFDNGYGASVVCHRYSYGGDEGLWEVAVIGPNGHLDYSTPITGDVIGYLNELGVDNVLTRIASLDAVA